MLSKATALINRRRNELEESRKVILRTIDSLNDKIDSWSGDLEDVDFEIMQLCTVSTILKDLERGFQNANK